MDFFGFVSLFGGLALFLYGMNIMGAGLTKTAGGKLEVLLERLSSSPIRGMLLGAGVTAVIQSSSATTVMVVGFVNSGLMKLSQATGIIIGANLGATITPWILSLSGINGGNFFLRLLNPSTFAPILGIIGAYFFIFVKKENLQNIGGILVGFFVLMTGMRTMSGAVSPLADDPQFTNLLLAFSQPLIGLLVGTVVTAVIQSSAASIGILQALALSGSVTYGTAIPIITGQNIGTCISALLSSIGAKTNARRAAFIHLYFNILKVAVFMVIFYSINHFVHFSFLTESIKPVNIAIIHSALNLFSVIIFMPFTSLLEKLAMMTLKDKPKSAEEEEISKYEKELAILDDRFMNSPALAVEQCLTVARRMAELSTKSIISCLDCINDYEESKYQRVELLENVVDVYEDRIGTYIVRLSQKQMNYKESNRLSIILHSISNFERITDHAINIAEVTKRMHDKERVFSEECDRELNIYTQAIHEIVVNTHDMFKTFDINMAKRIEPLEEVIDNLNERAKRHHIRRLRNGECTVDMGVHFDNIINDLERISDHCSNVAVALIEISENVYDAHEYINILKNTQSEEFQSIYKEYDKRFHLD